MIKIVGVRFRNAGKIYYFDPKDLEIRSGAHVIVETARGIEYGTVVGNVRDVTDDQVTSPLKSVMRLATKEDDERVAANREREREAMRICKEKIRKHELDMKLIDAEYTFDNNKILFYFTADGRVDFRELVKDLAAIFRTRIELRQIGVRDETKILGGIGICGRPLCCHSWLTDFVPVSIKMAKEQSLSLNPTKISGVCGRLMCCLKNEEETYEYLNGRMPSNGEEVTTSNGRTGTVVSMSVLRQKVKVLFEEGDEKEIIEYEVDELKFAPRGKKGKNGPRPQKNAQAKAGADADNDGDAYETEVWEAQEEEFTADDNGQNRKDAQKDRENRSGRGDARGHRERRPKGDAQGRNDAGKSDNGRNDNGRNEQSGQRENRGDRNRDRQAAGRDGRDNRENRDGRDGRDNRDNRDNRERRRKPRPENAERANGGFAEGRPEEFRKDDFAETSSEDARNKRRPRRRHRNGHGGPEGAEHVNAKAEE